MADVTGKASVQDQGGRVRAGEELNVPGVDARSA